VSSWNDYKEDRRDFDRAARWGVGRILLLVIGILLVGGLITWGIWGFNVATSSVKGQGDGIIQKNSAENWVDAQARFEENYADIEATQFKIKQASDALTQAQENGQPTKTLEQTLQGTINYCASVVGEYNADAKNYLREDFKRSNLPDHIDPETACSPPDEN
jgi:hypothetical protein